MKILECSKCHKLFKTSATPRMYVKLSATEEINFCPECTNDIADLLNHGLDQREKEDKIRMAILEDIYLKDKGII